MFKKNWFNFILAVAGLTLVILAFYFSGTFPKEYTGVMSGVGSGLVGVSLALILPKIYNKRNPQAAKWREIQVNDERSTFLRYKTNNSTRNVNQWLLFALAMTTILLKLPLWITLSLVAINLINSCLYVYFFNKYSKEI